MTPHPYTPCPHGQTAEQYAAAVVQWCLASGRPSDVVTLPGPWLELALHGSVAVQAGRYEDVRVHDRIAEIRRVMTAVVARRVTPDGGLAGAVPVPPAPVTLGPMAPVPTHPTPGRPSPGDSLQIDARIFTSPVKVDIAF